MSKLRILSIFMAVGLLAGAFGVGPVLAGQSDTTGIDTLDASYAPAQVSLDDEEVAWTDEAGDSISHVSPDNEFEFYVRDDALGSTVEGQVAEWLSFTNAGSTKDILPDTDGRLKAFHVANSGAALATAAGVIDDKTPKDAALVVGDSDFSYTLEGPDSATTTYAFATPATTPIATGHKLELSYTDSADDYVEYGAAAALVKSTAGSFTILGGTKDVHRLRFTFSYHKRDVWAGDSSDDRRARVYSSSDPAGEYVTITEYTAVGTKTAAYTSDIFHGSIELDSDAASQGQGADESKVWVQDGDTLTVEYLDDNGNRISTDTVTVDAIAPSIENLVPAGGTITDSDNPTVTFSVSDDGSSIDATKLTRGNDVITLGVAENDKGAGLQNVGQGTGALKNEAVSFVSVGAGQFNVTWATASGWKALFSAVNEGEAFYITVSATDAAGNEATATAKVTIDQGDPVMESAITGTGWNVGSAEEKTGMANAVRIRMSEAIDEDSVTGSDFEVDGVAAASAIVGASADDPEDNRDDHIYLTLASDLAPNAKPAVKIVGNVSDLAGNNVDTDASSDSMKTATDKLAPNIVSVTRDASLLVDDDEVNVTLVVDEKLKSGGSGALVFSNGPGKDGANKELTTSSDRPLTHTASLTVGDTNTTGMYGLSVQVTDLGNNMTDNLTSVSGEEATLTAVTGANTYEIDLAKGPVGDSNFDGNMDKGDIASLMIGGTERKLDITLVDAGKRTVTVKHADIDADDAVEVSYSYVPAANTFEIDQAAPSVTFTPAADANVPNASPFVTLEFNDDEYPGDNYTDVTLTSASLEMPDGTTQDVQSEFALESDGVTYVWAASGLALGGHTLSVTAEDVAGNEVSDSVSFSIVEKPAYSISLRPGWNLVSLPGNPVSTAIGDVITNESIKSVLTYDPSTPTKWLSAVREGDGWAGNLTQISGKLGYWVETSTFDPLEVDIPSLTSGGIQLPPTHSLVTGWNLVAVTVLDTDEKTVDATEYLGSFWLRAVTYNSTSGNFVSIGPDDVGEKLDVGKGYFVWMIEPDTIVP